MNRAPDSRVRPYVAGAVVLVALVVAALLFWHLRFLVLIIFAAILVAVGLRALSSALCRLTGLNDGFCFAAAAVAVMAVTGLFFYVLGAQLHAQLVQLAEELPELLSPLESLLGVQNIGEWLAERGEAMMNETAVMSRIAGLSGTAFTILAHAVLVLVAGFYMAYRPGLYLYGLILVFPPSMRRKTGETLDALAAALRRWLAGQAVAMLAVGLFTYAGLSLLGIESALALAFLAGVFEFVPLFGPVLAATPAIAIALTSDPTTVVWVLLLYVGIQQLEGNVLNPLIQQQAVSLPPAVTLFALLAFGILFGPLGVLFATPLAVVCLVLVKQLWVHDSLGENVSIPGEGEHGVEETVDREAGKGTDPIPASPEVAPGKNR